MSHPTKMLSRDQLLFNYALHYIQPDTTPADFARAWGIARSMTKGKINFDTVNEEGMTLEAAARNKANLVLLDWLEQQKPAPQKKELLTLNDVIRYIEPDTDPDDFEQVWNRVVAATKTPLNLNTRNEEGCNVMIAAAQKKNIFLMTWLKQRGAEIPPPGNQYDMEILTYAIDSIEEKTTENDFERIWNCVRYLTDGRVNLDTKNNDQCTVMISAAEKTNLVILKWLKENGATTLLRMPQTVDSLARGDPIETFQMLWAIVAMYHRYSDKHQGKTIWQHAIDADRKDIALWLQTTGKDWCLAEEPLSSRTSVLSRLDRESSHSSQCRFEHGKEKRADPDRFSDGGGMV